MADVNPIRTLLIANRGEIACRILRTAHEMGISTVVVYARGDVNEPFVREADVVVALDGTTALETYLHQQSILDAAISSGADAVHPGYGFLSENAVFASKVVDAGLRWIGPAPEAIASMGDKIAAKKLMREAGVPTLESIELDDLGDGLTPARELGFPLLVKAAAGGGGKGMRVVQREGELRQAIDGARREAASAFGDDRLFLEPWVDPVRHIEVQILGDRHGNLLHLFERECSVQRRHQKIIEECPSPVVDEKTREALGAAALAAGRQMGYYSAGTVEFLFSQGKFWFLEVNTRLQVEHPVTEAVTGVDLVREQIRIAQGEPLSFAQADLAIRGAAIEARLYAEDPAKEFLPAAGEVVLWEPPQTVGMRFDSGIATGSRIGIEFDPMIAKVISHADTRREAAAKLARALRRTRIHGLMNNRDFLVSILTTSEFLQGDTTTGFLRRVSPAASRHVTQAELHGAMIACAVQSAASNRASARVLRELPGGWRNSPMPPMRMMLTWDGGEYTLEYRQARSGQFAVLIGDAAYQVWPHRIDDGELDLSINARRSKWHLVRQRDLWFVQTAQGGLALREMPRFPSVGEQAVKGAATAPMPGKVLDIRVTTGERVKGGDLLLTLEAMKMEHQITAPMDGVVKEVSVEAGEQVANGAVLVLLDDDE